MGLAQINAEERELVVLREARVDVRGIRNWRLSRRDVGEDRGAVQVA